ncbi:MAG: preprotein translocase subunit YajC [Deltaproteobacteria bacterium]|nr:preprotein translocase subunit YajC [Deltaproteobacteria bacterium]
MSGFLSIAPLIFIFVIFYFLLIRPQQKKAKEHREMLEKLQKGDMVITSGGLYGKITGIAEDAITLEVADNVRVKVAKEHIAVKKGHT